MATVPTAPERRRTPPKRVTVKPESASRGTKLPAPLAMSLASTSSHGPAPPPPPGTLAQTPPFLSKLYNLVEDSLTNELVSWTTETNAFTVHKPDEFGRDVLPRYFKHNNFSSFVRQLNQYGFHKRDPDRWTFGHENFRRGRLDLLRMITRRRPKAPVQPTVAPMEKEEPTPADAKPQQAVVELGNFGLAGTLESLKRDKDVLIKELVITRKAEHKLQEKCDKLEMRVDMLENSTKHMQTFIMHYFSQVLQPYSDEIATRKRKRLPPAASQAMAGGAEESSSDALPPPPSTRTSLDALRRMMQQMQMTQVESATRHTRGAQAPSPPSPAFAPATVQELDESQSVASGDNSLKSSSPLMSSNGRPNGVAPTSATSLPATIADTLVDSSRGMDVDAALLTPNGSLDGLLSEYNYENVNAKREDMDVKAEAIIEELMDLPDDLELLPPLTELPDGTDVSALARQIQGFTSQSSP